MGKFYLGRGSWLRFTLQTLGDLGDLASLIIVQGGKRVRGGGGVTAKIGEGAGRVVEN